MMETRGLNNPADQSLLALQTSVDDLETRLTAARAGYLDNLSAGAVAQAASVGTLVNTGGGTATLGGILGDVANSSIATRLTTLAGYVDGLEAALGTLANTGEVPPTIAGILGNPANVSLAARLIALAAQVGTLINTGEVPPTLGGILGDVANTSIATRLIALAAQVGTLANTGAGAETLAAILGDVASVDMATRFGILQNHVGPSYNNSRYLSVAADFTNATWNDFVTTPKHEVFDVTGLVRLRLWITCTGDVDSTAHGATLCFGHASDTDAFIAATDETELDTGDLWYDATPTLACDTFANAVMDYVSNGLDVGYEIGGEALTTGALLFHCVWEPLSSTGNVTAGAGGTL
jgi:hypothetical protein